MSLTAAWVVPTSADLGIFIQTFVLNAANQNNNGALRADQQIVEAVKVFRGAIGTGNRVALSLTVAGNPPVGSIPPEAKWPLLVKVVESISASVPQLAEFVEGDRFQDMVDKANTWLSDVTEGKLVPTAPSDPDPTTVPTGPEWGDLYGVEVAGVSQGKIDVTTN